MRDCLLIYDLLSSGISTNIFTFNGERVAYAYRPHKVFFDGNKAWQPTGMWWDGALHTTRDALKNIDPSRIAGVSFTTQGMICVCVDADGNALDDAVACQDNRAVEARDFISEKITSDGYYEITGLRNSSGSSLRKFMWVKQFQPEVYEKTYKMIQCKDFLALKFTGKILTDFTDANIAGALDINKWEWSDIILKSAGINPDKMPAIAESNTVIGEVTPKSATETGIPEGTPVVMGLGDVASSALGAGLARLGQVYVNIGSSTWIAQCRKTVLRDGDRSIINSVHGIPRTLLCFVPSQETGIVFKWLKNEIFRYDTDRKREVEPFLNVYPYDNMGEQVLRSPIGANGVMCFPEVYRYGDEKSAGAYMGLTWENTREDMMRATLEGVCYELKNKLDFFRTDYTVNEITVVGAASKERTWLQMLADIFGVTVRNTTLSGSADAVGAAIVAGNALGVYKGFDEAGRFWRFADAFEPNPGNCAKYRELNNVYMAVKPAAESMRQKIRGLDV